MAAWLQSEVSDGTDVACLPNSLPFPVLLSVEHGRGQTIPVMISGHMLLDKNRKLWGSSLRAGDQFQICVVSDADN